MSGPSFAEGQRVVLRGEGLAEVIDLVVFDGESPPRPPQKREHANAWRVRTEVTSAVVPFDAAELLRPLATLSMTASTLAFPPQRARESTATL